MPWPTKTDIASRIGRALTSAEDDQAELLLDQAVSLVAGACDKDDDWADALDPIPTGLASIVIEATARAMAAPIGLRSRQETLGQHSYSESFPDQLAQGLQLTEAEELRARRIVFGSNSGGARAESIADDLSENYPA